MGNKMQRVVDCDTNNHGAYADDNQGHITSDDRDQSHGKQPSEQDGDTYQQQVLHLPERKDQQCEDQRDGDGDGPMAVALNLIGIADSDDWCSRDGNIDVRNSLHGLVDDTIHIFHQQAVVSRLHSTIR